MLLSRSGLTRLVDRLERQGLLRRERCASDARGLFAEITDEGRSLFAEARKTHLDGVRRLFLDCFSRDELRSLGALWEKVRQRARLEDIGAATEWRDRRRTSRIARASRFTASSSSSGSSSENDSRNDVCVRRSAVIASPGVKATPWRAASR